MLQLTHDAMRIIRSDQAKRDAKAALKRSRKTRRLGVQVRDRMVATVATILRTGSPTLFEFEGACRFGVRVSLTTEGWPWKDADEASSDVVERALKAVGAERPAYWEGQPEVAHPNTVLRYYCDQCGGLLDEEDRGRRRYCSKLCSNAAGKRRAKKFGEAVSLAEYLASCAHKREERFKARSGVCEQCDRSFIGWLPGNRFCSQACHAKSRRIHQPRDCPACGTTFKPVQRGKNDFQKYCSMACAAKNRTGTREKAPRPELTCKGCGSTFFAPYPSIVRNFCSLSCSSQRPRHLGKISCEEA